MVVSETTSETMMATESVTANSRNSRPTMPPISRIGMKTATSDRLMETHREADLARAAQGRLHRRHALLQVARDVLDHHDRVVHHEPRRDRQRHQREIVEAVTAQVHDAEGADQRDRAPPRWESASRARCAERGRPPGSPATTEMSSVISTSRTDARIVVVRSIMTERSIACGMDAFSAGSAALDAVHGVDHVRLRLLEDITRRRACRWRSRPRECLRPNPRTSAKSDSLTASPLW